MKKEWIPLMEHQRQACDFIMTRRNSAIFYEMGLGKTASVLEAIWETNPRYNVLIVAPKTVAANTWSDEIEKWNIPLPVCSLLLDENGKPLSKEKREMMIQQSFRSSPKIYLLNREMLVPLIESLPKINRKPVWPFPFVILDESQSFKSRSSKRFKALVKIRSQIDRIVLLSGTPSPQGLQDLWSQIFLLDQGERLGKTYDEYMTQFFNPVRYFNGKPVQYDLKPGANQEIYSRLQDLVLTKENKILQLPPITYRQIWLMMSPKEYMQYQTFLQTFILPVSHGIVTAANAAVLTNKLTQLASGSIYTDESRHYETVHFHKAEAVRQIILKSRSPVLIAYHYFAEQEIIRNYLNSAGISCELFDGSQKMLRRWNNQEIPVMLLQPASAGHGINIQQGGHILIWYSLPWSLEQYKQCNCRLYRKGQKHPVDVFLLLMKGTVDEQIMHALDTKDFSQTALLHALQKTIF